MPVDGRWRIGLIAYRDTNRVAFGHAQLGTRDLAIIGVRIHDLARRYLPLDPAHGELELAKLPTSQLRLRGRNGR